MRYIVACHEGEVLVAHVKHNRPGLAFYESRVYGLKKGSLESKDICSWGRYDRHFFEEDLYYDARVCMWRAPKEYGGEEPCTT